MSKTAVLVSQFLVYAFASSAGLILIKRVLPDAVTSVQGGRLVEAVTPSMVAGITLYVLSFAVWMVILSKSTLTVAYPIAIGLSAVGTLVGAVLILGESTSAIKIVGALLIVAGIALVSNG
jgi:small multidrug resistance pump